MKTFIIACVVGIVSGGLCLYVTEDFGCSYVTSLIATLHILKD